MFKLIPELREVIQLADNGTQDAKDEALQALIKSFRKVIHRTDNMNVVLGWAMAIYSLLYQYYGSDAMQFYLGVLGRFPKFQVNVLDAKVARSGFHDAYWRSTIQVEQEEEPFMI